MICPKCYKVLEKLVSDILNETLDHLGTPNCREYNCPYCNASLLVFIKIDIIEESDEEGEDVCQTEI